MGNEQDFRAYVAEYGRYDRRPPHKWMAAAFSGYVAVLDGDVARGVAAILNAVRRTRDEPAAPGQHAVTCRILLAAHVTSGDTPAALAAADRLLAAGAPGRIWEPLARRVRAELGPRS